MKHLPITRVSTIWLLSLFFIACGSKRGPLVKVPMAINIHADNSINFTNFNANFYRLNVKDILDDFQEINPVLVDEAENPEIIVDITVENFTIGFKDENRSRRTYRRTIQSGTDAAGKPVYETITATADIVQTRIPASARLTGKVTIKGNPPRVFQRNYYENFRWENVAVENIQGDTRAVDPAIYSIRTNAFEPDANEILTSLSKTDMLRDLSNEIRKYYNRPRN